jgi:hypothetical protein
MRKDHVLYINGKDAWLTWSAFLIEDSHDNLMQEPDLKSYVENDFRSQPGKRVSIRNPQPTDRNIQLMFDIQGTSMEDYNNKKSTLLAEMKGKIFELKYIPLMTIYKVYLPPGYFLGLDSDPGLSSGKLSVRLNEPNPTDRKTGDEVFEWVFKDGLWQKGYWLKGGRWGVDMEKQL